MKMMMMATATATATATACGRPRRYPRRCRCRVVVVANANANDAARRGGRRETLVALASSLAVCAPFVRARDGGGATARAGVR